jgi:hypothetical protein
MTAAMGPIERFTDACVTSAGRRWPADLSETMTYEWRAELAALRTNPGLNSMKRWWRAITFALSLACSSAVEKENPMTVTWRDRLPSLRQALGALLGVVGVALLAIVMPDLVSHLYADLQWRVHHSVHLPLLVILVAIAVAVMAWLGLMAARRSPFAGAPRRALMTGVLYTAPLGLVIYALLASRGQSPQVDEPDGTILMAIGGTPGVQTTHIGFAVLTWTVLSAATIAATLWLRSAGLHRTGRLVLVLGIALTVDIAAAVGAFPTSTDSGVGLGSAIAWLPASILPAGTLHFGGLNPVGDMSIHGSDFLLPYVWAIGLPLMMCSAFVGAFALRAASERATVLEQVDVDDAPVSVSLLVRRVALGASAIGLGAWAYVAALNTYMSSLDFSAQTVTAFRVLAIVTVAASVAVMVAGRGPVAASALGTLLVLFAADRFISIVGRHGFIVAVLMVAFGSGVVYCAEPFSDALADARSSGSTARRALVATAVASALSVPGFGTPDAWTPTSMVVAAYIIAGLLTVLAMVAALASRAEPLSRPVALGLVVIPLVIVMVYVSGRLRPSTFGSDQLFFMQALLAMTALAAARWRTSAPQVRQLVMWIFAAVVVTAVSLPVADEIFADGSIFGATFNPMSGDGGGVFDGLRHFGFEADVAGGLTVAVLVGVLVARWAVRSDAGEVDVVPAEPDFDPNDIASAAV